MSTAIEVSAAAYWSLRLDRDFDLFCAVKDGASFTLHSESEEADAEGNFWSRAQRQFHAAQVGNAFSDARVNLTRQTW